MIGYIQAQIGDKRAEVYRWFSVENTSFGNKINRAPAFLRANVGQLDLKGQFGEKSIKPGFELDGWEWLPTTAAQFRTRFCLFLPVSTERQFVMSTY